MNHIATAVIPTMGLDAMEENKICSTEWNKSTVQHSCISNRSRSKG
jgi:hypothetical protein